MGSCHFAFFWILLLGKGRLLLMSPAWNPRVGVGGVLPAFLAPTDRQGSLRRWSERPSPPCSLSIPEWGTVVPRLMRNVFSAKSLRANINRRKLRREN